MKQFPKNLKDLTSRLEPYVLNTHLRWSIKGVPHLVVTEHSLTCSSVCFFGRHRTWRVFRPYPGEAQTRDNFSTIEDVVNHYRER